MTSKLGFIILRHVNSELTDLYWKHCYGCIRNFYPENFILIIDDNSNYDYLKEINLYKTTVIKSEFHGRGELLPYYYYLQNKLFHTAVIIQDSVFINKYIDFENIKKYKIIWEFEHDWDQIDDEIKMIKSFEDAELLNFYENKNLWKGCFGGMCVISHEYLTQINNKYNLSKLLDKILNRYNRCSFERVIACLLQINERENSLLGNIHSYIEWGLKYDMKDKYSYLPMVKVWTYR